LSLLLWRSFPVCFGYQNEKYILQNIFAECYLNVKHKDATKMNNLAKRIMGGEGIEERGLRSGTLKKEGVTTSSVNRLVVSQEGADLAKYLKLF
jgi:hypothetical protein